MRLEHGWAARSVDSYSITPSVAARRAETGVSSNDRNYDCTVQFAFKALRIVTLHAGLRGNVTKGEKMKRTIWLVSLIVLFAGLTNSALVLSGGGARSAGLSASFSPNNTTVSAVGASRLSTPTLYCDGSTPKSIAVKFCAGTSGAPAGFSIQWQTLIDYQHYGWPADSGCPLDVSGSPTCGASLCKASFSG